MACDHPVRVGGADLRADAPLSRIPARAWQQVSCGTGAKGHRYYDWAFLRLDHDPGPGEQHGQHWLMFRRNQRTGELAFYRCWMPRPVPLAWVPQLWWSPGTQIRGLSCENAAASGCCACD